MALHLQSRPRGLLVLALLLSLLATISLSRQKWQLSLLDLFPKNLPARKVAEEINQRFGGIGTLLLVVHSPDSAHNASIIAQVSKQLSTNPLVNFVEFSTHAEFYRRHKLLYISYDDLLSIRDRIAVRLNHWSMERNPLLVNLESTDTIVQDTEPLNLEELEKKYLRSLRDFLGNASGTIQIAEIYPRGSVENLEYCRALLRTTLQAVHEARPSANLEFHFAGKVAENARSSGSLLGEMRKAAIVAALLVFILLALHLFRQPQMVLLTCLPLGLSLLWTMGLTLYLYGHFNLFTLSLNVFLLGLGAVSLIHLLSRYGEERRKGIGPQLAFESIILETGPTVSTSTLVCAGAFFSLRFLPLSGVSQFGTLGGLGLLFQWIAVMLLFPAMLLYMQRKGRFRIYGQRLPSFQEEGEHPFSQWKIYAILGTSLTLILLLFGGIPKFTYDFSKTEFPPQNPRALELLDSAGYPVRSPAIVLTSGIAESRELGDYLELYKRNNPESSLGQLVTLTSLLPSRQQEKLELLAEIREMLPDRLAQRLHGIDSINIHKIMEHWDVVELDEFDLPLGHRIKFRARDGKDGQFGFIFPAIDVLDGKQAMRFAKEFRAIALPSGNTLYTTGEVILRAELLRLVLPYFPRIMALLLSAIFLVVLLQQNRFHRTIVVLIPPTFGMLWLLLSLQALDIEINIYSLLLLPMLFGLAVDGSLHLFQRWREEGTGSISFVLSRTGRPVLVASLTAMTGFSGLLFSGHPGLRSMGVLALLGLFCILTAHLIIFPALVGWLDSRRFQDRTITNINT